MIVEEKLRVWLVWPNSKAPRTLRTGQAAIAQPVVGLEGLPSGRRPVKSLFAVKSWVSVSTSGIVTFVSKAE